jgi:hypothetical protein
MFDVEIEKSEEQGGFRDLLGKFRDLGVGPVAAKGTLFRVRSSSDKPTQKSDALVKP